MIALYDHIVAILVGGIILLLLFNVQQRVQQSSVERTMMYMAKTTTLDLASFMERDLMNAGFDTPPVASGVLMHHTNTDGVTDTLVFWGVGSAGTRTRVAYGVSVADTATIDDEEKPLYQLRRYERQGSTFVLAGGSAPTLTGFKVDLLTSGNTPTDINTARRLRVRLTNAVLPDFDDAAYLKGYRQLHWGVTLNPPGLQ